VIDDFAADGQLAKAIPGFKPREPQRQMAVAVSHAIAEGPAAGGGSRDRNR
jgi:ATP-dependent DNA helicase DinG